MNVLFIVGAVILFLKYFINYSLDEFPCFHNPILLIIFFDLEKVIDITAWLLHYLIVYGYTCVEFF